MNKKFYYMKALLSIFLFYTIQVAMVAQDCQLINKITDSESGTITEGGVVTTKEGYAVLVQKQTFPGKKNATYTMLLTTASKDSLSENQLNSKGNFELLLANEKTKIISDAECSNKPFPFKHSLGFKVQITAKVVKELSLTQIVSIKMFDFASVNLSGNKQKQLQKILECLTQSD